MKGRAGHTGPPRRSIPVPRAACTAAGAPRDEPALRGRPVAVGGSRERGVVAAASYEARRYGVRSAMPSVTARRQCPELVFVRPRFDVYKRVSQQVRAILADYTPLIQPLSLDEAYLDVTAPLLDRGSATAIAREIRARIRAETGLTASAGVSYNKFLAKLASDHRKPDGLFVITPAMGPGFVAALEVSRFHGVGPVTAAKMERLGIRSGRDLVGCTAEFLTRHFGRAGAHYHAIGRGLDERPVVADRRAKSIGAQHTCARDLAGREAAGAARQRASDKVWTAYDRDARAARTVTLKLKYADFRLITRSSSLPRPIASRRDIADEAARLLRAEHPFALAVRLLGVSVSRFAGESGQDGNRVPDLFAAAGCRC